MERKKLYSFVFVGTLLILGGCGKMNAFSPEHVISNALDAENTLSYYGEMEMSMDGFEDMDSILIKEWRHHEKSRIEVEADGEKVITVNDGETVQIYEENRNKVLQISSNELGDYDMNPREQVEILLGNIQDTHDIQLVGEEVISDRPAIHLVAKKKKNKNSLTGDQEFWFDKEYWLLLKMKTMVGDNVNEIEYTTIEFNAKMQDSLFRLDLSDDVVIETLADYDQDDMEEEITLSNIPEKLGSPVLYIPDSDEHKLGHITYTENEVEASYREVTIDYNQNGLPLITLFIVEMNDGDEDQDIFGEDLKEKIRGQDGIYIDMTANHSISWNEDNFNYYIEINDPKVTLDQVKKWAEEMEEIK